VATGLEVEAFTLTSCGVREVLREHGYVEEESFVSLSLILVVRRCFVRFGLGEICSSCAMHNARTTEWP
jgi:hypothetical protein